VASAADMLVLRGAVYGSSMPKRQEVYPEVQVESGFCPRLNLLLQELLEFCKVKVCQAPNAIQPSPLILDRTTDKPIILGFNLIHAIKPRG